MKIKSVSCRQFAGLRNLQPVRFQDGLNIIYGPNESGKSTLVGLIYSLLWQNSKVGGRKDKDKKYKKLYFPAEVRTGSRGNTIDGKIVIDGEDGEYTISKRWGAEQSGELETPTAVLYENSDSKAYTETIKTLLKYGEGVYREAIFANQKTIDSVLEALLGGKLESDLSAVATSAMLDMGGISSEKFLNAIDKKMKDLEDSWDWRTDGPKGGRGIDNEIVRNAGSILKAYYDFEKSRKKLGDLQNKVNAVGKADRAYAKAQAKYEEAERALKEFGEYYTLLVNYKNVKDLQGNAQKEKEKREDVAEQWPKLLENFQKASKLEQELARAEVIDLWEKIRSIKEQDAEAKRLLSELQPVKEDDVTSTKGLADDIRKIENKLKKFSALISFSLQEGYELNVTNIADDRKVDLEGSAFEVTEAVRIEIPGVAVFDLSATKLNVDEAKADLEAKRTNLKSLLDKYNVDSVPNLEGLKKSIDSKRIQLVNDCQRYADDLKRKVSGRDINDIQAEYEAAMTIPTRSMETIQNDIKELTSEPIRTFVRLCDQKIEDYKKEFISQDENANVIVNLTKKIGEYENTLQEADKIPEEYLKISDPEKRKQVLENRANEEKDKRDSAKDELADARGIIKALEESDDYASVEDLQEIVSDKEAELARLKEDFKAWQQIKTVAEGILNSTETNPLQQFEDDFRNYLAVLSGDGITLSSLGKKMEVDIYSGDNRMTFELLSEGTKDTVALAFRLAVIKFLFPDGGGFAVFDDPFTDMDAERRSRACSLLMKFAENNQIIFVTCDRSYANVMKGTLIDFSEIR